MPARSCTSRESVARLGQVEPRRDAVERLERERDLDQVGVPRPLAHPVDRALHPRRARLHGRDRSGRAEPEVVVPVPVDGNLPAEPVDGLPDEVRGRLRRRDPDRVDDDDLLRRRPRRPCRRPAGRTRGRRATSRRRRTRPRSRRRSANETALRIRSSIASRETPSAVELPVRDRALDHRGRDAELDERLHVGLDGAGEAPDLGAQAGADDELDRAPVVVGDAREARLDPIDAGGIERARDLELVLRHEHDADGLLAIAQRRVVEADGACGCGSSAFSLRLPVQILLRSIVMPGRSRPGSVESFSGPVFVIRKLSSTRRPPPPSQ